MGFLLPGNQYQVTEQKLTNSDPLRKLADKHSIFYVAAVVKPLLAYFFPCLLWMLGPVVRGCLATLVDTQLRLTHVLPPMRVQTRSRPIDLCSRLR